MSTIAETDKRRERRSTERLEVQAAITCKVSSAEYAFLILIVMYSAFLMLR